MPINEKTESYETKGMNGTFRDIQHAINAVDIWAGALVGFSQPVPQSTYHLPRAAD